MREPYGAAAMPPLHERDLAAAAVLALVSDGHNGEICELTGPETLTQAEQASTIREVIGRPVHWEDVSPQAARQQMLARGQPRDRILQALAEMVTEPKAAAATVAEVTGAPARTFRTRVSDHAG